MGGAIRRQAERIARMADDLYDVSRLEAQSLLLTPRPVDLAFSDDPKLMPLRMQVSVSYLPLIVEFAQWCQAGAPCGW